MLGTSVMEIVVYVLTRKYDTKLIFWIILGFHVTSPNSRIQNREAYKILASFKERLPKKICLSQFLSPMSYFLLKIEQFQFPSFHRA